MFRLAVFIFAVFFLLPVTIGEERAAENTGLDEVEEKISAAAEALKKYSVQQREQATARLGELLAELDAMIESLEQRLTDEGAKMDRLARDKARATLQRLREERTRLAEWYGGMKYSSAGAWEQIQKGLDESFDAFSEAMKRAAEEFSQDSKKE